MIRYTVTAAIVAFLCTTSRGATQASLDLNELVREALQNNPSVVSAREKSEVSREKVSQAGALPDPMLTFGLMNMPVNSFDFNQEPMTGKMISAIQTFPFPGKLGLAEDMAELDATVARYQEEEVRNRVVTAVRRGYYELYAISRAIETIESNQALMEKLADVAETKYKTGKGLQQDVLRAYVEISKLEDDLLMWQQRQQTARIRLNTLLSRAADSPLGETPQSLPLPDAVPTSPTTDELAQGRPVLKAWQEMVKKAEAGLKLARRDYWPNFTVGASYSQRDDLKSGAVMHDFFSATLSLNVPVYFWRKQSAKVHEKESDLAYVKSEYENLQDQVVADVESLLAELGRYRKRIALFDGGILLQARQSLESALSGYQVGKVDFLTLINNWMMLQNYELQYHLAVADYHKALADYELATGRIAI